jgi:hypothetical protein
MQNKLAGLMAVMAFVILAVTWTVRKVIGMPVMHPVHVLTIALGVLLLYFFVVGRIAARIGIMLIQDELMEQRARKERIRHEARMMAQQANEASEAGREIEENTADMIAEAEGRPTRSPTAR